MMSAKYRHRLAEHHRKARFARVKVAAWCTAVAWSVAAAAVAGWWLARAS